MKMKFGSNTIQYDAPASKNLFSQKKQTTREVNSLFDRKMNIYNLHNQPSHNSKDIFNVASKPNEDQRIICPITFNRQSSKLAEGKNTGQCSEVNKGLTQTCMQKNRDEAKFESIKKRSLSGAWEGLMQKSQPDHVRRNSSFRKIDCVEELLRHDDNKNTNHNSVSTSGCINHGGIRIIKRKNISFSSLAQLIDNTPNYSIKRNFFSDKITQSRILSDTSVHNKSLEYRGLRHRVDTEAIKIDRSFAGKPCDPRKTEYIMTPVFK